MRALARLVLRIAVELIDGGFDRRRGERPDLGPLVTRYGCAATVHTLMQCRLTLWHSEGQMCCSLQMSTRIVDPLCEGNAHAAGSAHFSTASGRAPPLLIGGQ